MLRTIFTLIMALLFVGCGPRYVDYFPFHDDGTPKPKVALLPIMNHSQICAPWDISSELNSEIRYKAMCKGSLFLISEEDIGCALQRVGKLDYFGSDFSYANHFCDVDYIVAVDLIEHEIVSRDKCDCSHIPFQKYKWNSLLQMKLRLRIVDIRCSKPRIALQEILACDYAIPSGCEYMDYTKCGWGSGVYSQTPWGMAHERLASDLVSRMETIIKGP